MNRTSRKRQAKGHNMNDMISAPPMDQAALWNGPAGLAWIDSRTLLDDLFAPFAERLADPIGPAGASRILDIGCGTGATTLAAARRLGEAGRATGVDISQPMIDLARARAAAEGLPAEFHCGDAQSHDFRSEEHTSELQSLMRISSAVFCLKTKTITKLKRIE